MVGSIFIEVEYKTVRPKRFWTPNEKYLTGWFLVYKLSTAGATEQKRTQMGIENFLGL